MRIRLLQDNFLLNIFPCAGEIHQVWRWGWVIKLKGCKYQCIIVIMSSYICSTCTLYLRNNVRFVASSILTASDRISQSCHSIQFRYSRVLEYLGRVTLKPTLRHISPSASRLHIPYSILPLAAWSNCLHWRHALLHDPRFRVTPPHYLCVTYQQSNAFTNI